MSRLPMAPITQMPEDLPARGAAPDPARREAAAAPSSTMRGPAQAEVRRLPMLQDAATEQGPAASAFDSEPGGKEPIGRILVDARRLAATEVDRVLDAATRYKLRFGEAALRLGLLERKDIDFALARQFSFPYVNPERSSISKEVIAAHAPDDPRVAPLRVLRSRISARAAEDSQAPLAIAIVSPARGDGRSFIASNLAVFFAQLGRSTLLIDASARTARQHELFRLDNGDGLSTLLAGRADLRCLRPIEEVPCLHVLPAGPMPPNLLELMERARCADLLRELQCRFDVVLIDTPAGDDGGEGPLLAARSGSALIVARADCTLQRKARAFALKLEQARTRVLGVVFNERH